jgi:hypothetical protein
VQDKDVRVIHLMENQEVIVAKHVMVEQNVDKNIIHLGKHHLARKVLRIIVFIANSLHTYVQQ